MDDKLLVKYDCTNLKKVFQVVTHVSPTLNEWFEVSYTHK